MSRLLPALLAALIAVGALQLARWRRDRIPASAATPIERLHLPQWAARHEQLAERSREGGVEVLFLGDSLTHFWEGPGREAWGTLAALKPGNYGIAGDQTGHVLWRITAGKELEGINPRAAVLLIGTNNLSAGHTPEQVAEGIQAIVAKLCRQKPDMKILLPGLFPRSPGPEDVLRRQIEKTNEAIRRLADGKALFYRDIGGRCLEEDGSLGPEIMPDSLHLSPKGYAIWAGALRADLERLTRRGQRRVDGDAD